jgi:hypothetical protein
MILACIVAVGCRNARVQDLPGRYVAKTDQGESVLILREDHSMVQEVYPFRGTPNRISGSWGYDGAFLTVKPCFEVKSSFSSREISACIDGVEVTPFGSTKIAMDAASGLSYTKTQQP